MRIVGSPEGSVGQTEDSVKIDDRWLQVVTGGYRWLQRILSGSVTTDGDRGAGFVMRVCHA